MAGIVYRPDEYMEMIILYGECGRNAADTAREYAARFPDRRHPDAKVILRLIQRGRETGSLMSNKKGISGAPRMARIMENEEAVLDAVEADPTISIRSVADMCNMSYTSVQRILKSNEMHPFHYTRLQNLHEGDYELRREFCRWILNQNQLVPNFTETILFTDESCFARDGVFNLHNHHYWAVENPHVTAIRSHQEKFKINLWAGIFNNHLVGPCEVPARLNGENYTDFLSERLPGLLEDIPLRARQDMWFQHDGAPPHSAIAAREELDRQFPERWIGRGGTVRWPPHSPDLNPIDFFLWAHMKNRVYREEIINIEDLWRKIQDAVNTVTPDMLQRTQNQFVSRVRACLECDGGHLEHLL